MFDLRKLFAHEARARDGAPDPDSDFHPSDRKGEGVEPEYQSLIASQFRRMGIAPGCVTIEVRKIGQSPEGLDVLVGLVRLVRWDHDSALRVLLGLPLLEAKLRRALRSTWLADFSYFGGLWLHSSEQLHADGDAMSELRHLLRELAPPAPSSTRAASGAGQGGTSGYPSSSPPITHPGQLSGNSGGQAGASESGEQEPVAS